MVAPLILAIPKLLSLASIVPSLMKYVGAGDNAIQIAEQAVGIAQTITGVTNSDEAIKILNTNSEKAQEFRLKIQEQEKSWDEMYLKDVQSARDRDAKLAQAGYTNKRAHLLAIAAFVGVGVTFFVVITSPDLNEYEKGIITLVLGRMLGYVDAIYNFEFGTTRSSKAKDDTINKLTKNNGG